jgi:hypothetical protein
VTGAAPSFAIGEGYAVYRGPTTAGTLHRHAAFQIVIGMRDDVAVVDASDVGHRAATLVVAPMERHCLQAAKDVLTYFVEPHCVFADRLRERYGSSITAAPNCATSARTTSAQPAFVRPTSLIHAWCKH